MVIPTIRNLDFLASWGEKFKNCNLLVIEDHNTKQIHTPIGAYKSINHFTWQDIATDFGEKEWIFSRQNAGVRSYGFWKAYTLGADIIVTIDDDCYPADKDFISQHVANLRTKAPLRWFPTFPHPRHLYTRGFPYQIRNKQKIVMSHGLWSNKMDMDARTQLATGDVNVAAYPPIRQFVPQGMYFPMSSMNLAFSREITPLMYFPLMGKNPQGDPWGYDRFDDIWAGIIAKKIIDHLGLAVVNGSPFVEHRKASDPRVNLLKERRGISQNEALWHKVDDVPLWGESVSECYMEIIQKCIFPNTPYFLALKKAMAIWIHLFDIT